MKTNRKIILRTLLSFPKSTINNLAEAVGINGISIRHHLTALEVEGLVSSSEERHGVGRPHLIYSLTDKGMEQFPTRYLHLSKYLLDSLTEKISRQDIKNLFKIIGGNIAKSYEEQITQKPIRGRLNLLIHVLEKEGFIAELNRNKDFYTLNLLSCPFYQIGLAYPEICDLDFTLISKFFTEPVSMSSCIFEGDSQCTYHISDKVNLHNHE